MDDATGSWLPAAQPKGTSCELKNLVENHKYGGVCIFIDVIINVITRNLSEKYK